MSRKMTGFVPGGIQARQLPSPIQPGELAVHAVGRLNTMAEILVQSACLRAANFVSHATGFGKAKFQDIKGDYSGTNKIAAAHRAMLALHLDGQNAADVAPVLTRPRLRQLIICATSAHRPCLQAGELRRSAVGKRRLGTRLCIVPVNARAPTSRSTGRENLLVDAAIQMKRLIHDGFDVAADAFRAGQRARGWQEFRPGSGPAPLAGVTDGEIDSFLDTAFGGGMKVQVAGPTHYGDLTEIVLGISQQITDRASPAISVPGKLEAQIAAVESATE